MNRVTIFWLALLLVSLGTLFLVQVPVKPAPATLPMLTAGELAARVETAYTESNQLTFQSYVRQVEQPRWQLFCSVEHLAPETVKLTVKEGSRVVYELSTELDEAGTKLVAREKNSLDDLEKTSTVPLEEFRSGQWDFVGLGRLDGCRFGRLTRSMIGPTSDFPSLIGEIIAQGNYQGTAEIDRQPCYLVTVSRNQGTVRDRLLIDPKTFLIRRWQIESGGLTKIAEYRYDH